MGAWGGTATDRTLPGSLSGMDRWVNHEAKKKKKEGIWEVKIKSSAKEYFPLSTFTKMTRYEQSQARAAPLTRPGECFRTAVVM